MDTPQIAKSKADQPPLLLELKGAGYQKSGKWLVENIDLRLHQGQIVTLIGPNGSGKSTTMRLALGLLTPSTGQSWQKPDLQVGYVPQSLKIDQNLPLNVGRFLGLTKSLSFTELCQLLKIVGLMEDDDSKAKSFLARPINNLSGGEFQRLMLARALSLRPELLVLDEPMQGVDLGGQILLYKLISKIRDELGCGILLISHDLHQVMAATDLVICLNGHICCQGSPDIVKANKEYQQIFGLASGEPLPIAHYEHHHDHSHDDDGDHIHPHPHHHSHNHS